MAITYVNQWAYTDSNTQSFQTNSNQPFCYVGKDNNAGIYYTYVVKLQTSTTLLNPTLKLYMAGTDNTSADKWLSAKFVPCTSSETPSSTYIGKAVNGDTRLRFGRVWDGSSWSGSGSNPAEGRTTNVTIPKGYFFIYITHHSSSTYQHSFSTIRVWTATANTPVLTGTEAYIITYNANGGSGTTASQTVVAGNSVKLQNNGFTAPTSAVHGITLKDSDGTALASSTYSTFKNNAFYQWLINSNYYAAGSNYTPTADVTAKASWSTNYTLKKVTKSPTTATGFTITYNPNGGTCSKTSETMTDTTTYEHIKWVSGTSEYNPTATLGGPAAYTFTVKYSSTTTMGSTTLPTPKNETNSTLEITFNYQGGSGSPSSASSTKTITKTFKGWAASSSASSGSTGSYTPDKNLTLYAIWGSSTVKYSAIDLPTPTKTGYKFMGWATSISAAEGSFGSYTPTSDSITTLYAIWEANGNIRIYVNSTDKYKMAMVYVYAPTSTSDTKPWKLAIPYLYTSGTQPWKIVAG